jgi:hypothetical protein
MQPNHRRIKQIKQGETHAARYQGEKRFPAIIHAHVLSTPYVHTLIFFHPWRNNFIIIIYNLICNNRMLLIDKREKVTEPKYLFSWNKIIHWKWHLIISHITKSYQHRLEILSHCLKRTCQYILGVIPFVQGTRNTSLLSELFPFK